MRRWEKMLKDEPRQVAGKGVLRRGNDMGDVWKGKGRGTRAGSNG